MRISFKNTTSLRSRFTSSKINTLLTCFKICKLFVIHLMMVNSFFIDYLYHLSLKFCVMLFSQHLFFASLSFRIFLNCEIHEINVSRKFSCNKAADKQMVRKTSDFLLITAPYNFALTLKGTRVSFYLCYFGKGKLKTI